MFCQFVQVVHLNVAYVSGFIDPACFLVIFKFIILLLRFSFVSEHCESFNTFATAPCHRIEFHNDYSSVGYCPIRTTTAAQRTVAVMPINKAFKRSLFVGLLVFMLLIRCCWVLVVGLVKAEKQDVSSLNFDSVAVIRAQEMSKTVGAYGITYERVNVVNELEQGFVAGFARTLQATDVARVKGFNVSREKLGVKSPNCLFDIVRTGFLGLIVIACDGLFGAVYFVRFKPVVIADMAGIVEKGSK